MNAGEKAARKRMGGRSWDGLEPMIEEYAETARKVARSDFAEELDWSAGSLERLERILNRICPAPDPLPPADTDWLTLLWGSYFGETLRSLHGGAWAMTVYPGTEFTVPTLELGSSKLYPMLKVHRRLSMGAEEAIPRFYAMLRQRLAAAPAGEPPRE